MSLQERARNTRSHSLKPIGQPSLLFQRSKRTLSLPAKPVIPPLINIQRYHDNWESNSDEDELICDTPEEESMCKCSCISCRENVSALFNYKLLSLVATTAKNEINFSN